MANFTNGRETMEKLAKHIEACTTLRVEYVPEMMCGDYTEDNMGLIHHLYNVLEVSEYGEDKKVYIFLFGNDIDFCEVVPHKGYRITDIISNNGTQAQMFTKTAIQLDRIFRR